MSQKREYAKHKSCPECGERAVRSPRSFGGTLFHCDACRYRVNDADLQKDSPDDIDTADLYDPPYGPIMTKIRYNLIIRMLAGLIGVATTSPKREDEGSSPAVKNKVSDSSHSDNEGLQIESQSPTRNDKRNSDDERKCAECGHSSKADEWLVGAFGKTTLTYLIVCPECDVVLGGTRPS